MEMTFVLIAIGVYVLGVGTGLAIDTMFVRTRKKPMPLLGVVLPPEEKK